MKNTNHISKINALIPLTETEAKRKVKEFGKVNELRDGALKSKYNHDFKTEFFHQAMNRLAVEAGLRVA